MGSIDGIFAGSFVIREVRRSSVDQWVDGVVVVVETLEFCLSNELTSRRSNAALNEAWYPQCPAATSAAVYFWLNRIYSGARALLLVRRLYQMANPLASCVSSLRSTNALLSSSISILDSGVNDFPRLAKVLQTTRVCFRNIIFLSTDYFTICTDVSRQRFLAGVTRSANSPSISNSSPNPPSNPHNPPSLPH